MRSQIRYGSVRGMTLQGALHGGCSGTGQTALTPLSPIVPPPVSPLPPSEQFDADAPPGLDAARRQLLLADPALSRVEEVAGPLPWRTRPRGFPGLLRAICGQMISDRAATAIWLRLAALPGALTPEGLLRLDDAALCGTAGLSRPKAAHARALALAVVERRLRPEELPGMGDAEALAHLTAIPGLGRWTAQVHLLFAEGREDIFPDGDLALAAGLAHLRGLPARPAPRELARLAASWAPQRSLAARLIWHWWRHATYPPALLRPPG